MGSFFSLLLSLHSTSGGIGLLVGCYIMFARKGGVGHARLGRVYLWAMALAAGAALPMALHRGNFFLFLVGIFTLYLLYTGYRYIRTHSIGTASAGDWVVIFAMLFFALSLLGYGGFCLVKGWYFGTVPLAFGSIGLLMVFQDWRNHTGRSLIRNYHLTTHLQRMAASYIANTTAFLVVNNSLLPGVVAWLLPTALVTPLIFAWTARRKVLIEVDKPS